MFNRPRNNEPNSFQNIPVKANLVLNIIFCILLLIALRIWHLAVIQHDKKLEEAFSARKRTLIEPAARGTIRDRFNTLLAANRLEYRVAIVYSQFREIPAVVVDKATKTKRFLRREYIKKLAERVAKILDVDNERLEDVIHSHAAQNNSIPLVIKKGLTEREYYKLKLLEKDWQGLVVQCVPKRYYPRGRACCDVIGYMGPISKEKYTSIVTRIRTLTDYMRSVEEGQDCEMPEGISSYEEAESLLAKLVEKAYTINDSVGLLGIEASFEHDLRGYFGKKTYFGDAKGNVLRYLPGTRAPIPGKRVLLSLSVELQEYAEQLLAQAETDREESYRSDPKAKKAKEPLIRGGAVVAIDPKTGEVVTLASFPRYNPNDFIRTKSAFFSDEPQAAILRWLENEEYIGKIWDGMLPYSVQRYSEKTKQFVDVEEYLSWDRFLALILPEHSELLDTLHSSQPIKKLIELQQNGLEANMLAIDLSRLVLASEDFSPDLIAKVGDLTIDQFRNFSSAYAKLTSQIRKEVFDRWRKAIFMPWRKENEKAFLKQKRLEEKRLHTYPKPYLDYLDKEEARQFDEFWQNRRFDLVFAYLTSGPLPSQLSIQLEALSYSERIAFLSSLRGFKDLKEPLYGNYPRLTGATLQDLVMGVKKGLGEGSLRSYAYRHAAIQGSLFKLVTAYAGLKQRYEELKGQVTSQDLTLFEIVDRTFKQNGKNYVGAFSSGAPIPQIYKGGRIPKSLYHDLGKLNLLTAIGTSSNPYFSLLAGDYLHDPMQLYQAAEDFGFGQKTGIMLPGEMSGSIPKDITTNRTGLYSMAIGQHSLLTTPLQSACMLSAIATCGKVPTPSIVNLVAGSGYEPDQIAPHNEVCAPKLREPREIFMPKEVQKTLLDGLKKVMHHIHEDRSGALRRLSTSRPDQYRAFMEYKDTMLGKTSTAESQEKIGIDIGQPSIIYNHTWFGGISYLDNEPDLVVIVYQRYGGYGRETAPIAAQIIKKWREIRARNS